MLKDKEYTFLSMLSVLAKNPPLTVEERAAYLTEIADARRDMLIDNGQKTELLDALKSLYPLASDQPHRRKRSRHQRRKAR
jgi:truncated hemoglobin YjbI